MPKPIDNSFSLAQRTKSEAPSSNQCPSLLSSSEIKVCILYLQCYLNTHQSYSTSLWKTLIDGALNELNQPSRSSWKKTKLLIDVMKYSPLPTLFVQSDRKEYDTEQLKTGGARHTKILNDLLANTGTPARIIKNRSPEPLDPSILNISRPFVDFLEKTQEIRDNSATDTLRRSMAYAFDSRLHLLVRELSWQSAKNGLDELPAEKTASSLAAAAPSDSAGSVLLKNIFSSKLLAGFDLIDFSAEKTVTRDEQKAQSLAVRAATAMTSSTAKKSGPHFQSLGIPSDMLELFTIKNLGIQIKNRFTMKHDKKDLGELQKGRFKYEFLETLVEKHKDVNKIEIYPKGERGSSYIVYKNTVIEVDFSGKGSGSVTYHSVQNGNIISQKPLIIGRYGRSGGMGVYDFLPLEMGDFYETVTGVREKTDTELYYAVQIRTVSTMLFFMSLTHDSLLTVMTADKLAALFSPGCFSLSKFSIQDLESLQKIPEPLWKLINGFNEDLYRDIQSLNAKEDTYKNVKFSPRAIKFIEALLKKNGKDEQAAKLVSSHEFSSVIDQQIKLILESKNDSIALTVTEKSQACTRILKNVQGIGGPSACWGSSRYSSPNIVTRIAVHILPNNEIQLICLLNTGYEFFVTLHDNGTCTSSPLTGIPINYLPGDIRASCDEVHQTLYNSRFEILNRVNQEYRVTIKLPLKHSEQQSSAASASTSDISAAVARPVANVTAVSLFSTSSSSAASSTQNIPSQHVLNT